MRTLNLVVAGIIAAGFSVAVLTRGAILTGLGLLVASALIFIAARFNVPARAARDALLAKLGQSAAETIEERAALRRLNLIVIGLILGALVLIIVSVQLAA